MDKVVFTHIPKTAGTSLMKALVLQNVPEERVYEFRGFRRWIFQSQDHASVICGHGPYGVAVLKKWNARYATFLRDPVERCISYYYYIQDCPPEVWSCADRKIAERRSLADFCRMARFRDVQTHYIAGIIPYRLKGLCSGRRLLDLALRNLRERYECYGLAERFADSVELFQRTFGWDRYVPQEPQSRTKARPSIEELDTETVKSIRRSNSLDVELYEWAKAHFDEQRGR